MDDALKALNDTVRAAVQQTIENKPQELVEQLEKKKAEQEKHSVEDEVRAHLRGFARTIPSFIMAYGDENLRLSNFDEYTEDDVFLEVTGITEDDFRFLRDGGDYTNEETGAQEHFAGHLFDETVFNDSVKEFWPNLEIFLAQSLGMYTAIISSVRNAEIYFNNSLLCLKRNFILCAFFAFCRILEDTAAAARDFCPVRAIFVPFAPFSRPCGGILDFFHKLWYTLSIGISFLNCKLRNLM